ncbi:hypothetical protein [Qipengyuania sp. NPDC077563]|uniref:hypothetical protein n=1 Tax=Qipengyuania sp. NPDC077563 TaxID=3364497 RepID=UPI00384CC071
MTEDRHEGPGQFPGRQLFFAWMAVVAILLLSSLGQLRERQFPDPDDILRLVQVRDLLAGQAWFDPTQYRIDPPLGTPTHWSRLVDLPILAVIALTSPLFGQDAAEQVALIGVPMLTFGLTAAMIGRLAWRLLGARVAVFAILSCGFVPAILFQYRPMRIDHHGWQIFSVMLALWAISWRDARKGGWVAGLAMAFGVSVSVELLPMAGAFGSVLFLRWWHAEERQRWLVSYMQALSGGITLFYLATRGLSLLEYCDAISPAHIAFFLMAAGGTWVISAVPQPRTPIVLLLFAFVGGAALGIFALISPKCLATPFAQLDPVVDALWYRQVLEGQPLWRQSSEYILSAIIPIAAASGAVVALWMRSQGWARLWWAEYLCVLVAASGLALLVSRSLIFAAAIATIPIAWLASVLLMKLRRTESMIGKLGFAALFTVILVPVAPLQFVSSFAPAAQDADRGGAELGAAECRVQDQVSLLNALPASTIFTPLDIGPQVLLDTQHSVVATSHHRSERAMADVLNGFTGAPERAQAIIRRHNAAYLALCTDVIETSLYKSVNPDGLAAALIRGDTPTWLEPVDVGQAPEFAVYRVLPQTGHQTGTKSIATPLMQ